MQRPTWDEYFMEMAQVAAKRSTCLRRSVGAVVVKNQQIVATGYNGSPMGLPHCEEVGCLREQLKIPSGKCQELCRAVHAEQNAITQAAYHGVSLKGCTIYVTHQPCVVCTKMLINAGIERVVYANPYPDELAQEMMKESQMQIEIFNARALSKTPLTSHCCKKV